MNKLIEKAKQSRKEKTKYTLEEVELAVAWARNEVTLREVQRAMEYKSPQIYGFLARALRIYVGNNCKL